MTGTLLHILMAVHTLIGAVSTFCLAYLCYAAFKRRSPASDKLLMCALIWPLVNLIAMAANGMVCPLQNAAQALAGQPDGQQAGWVRDMYWVPQSWLKLVPWTYGPSYLIGATLVWWRSQRKKGGAARAP
jgi:hypothetical protein